ncbi:MAG: stage V sporulation protein AD [Anaerovoracaceae bacterium]|jgi:stage V sporulation protein AD
MYKDSRKVGKQTFLFPGNPKVSGAGTIVGEKEGAGPMGKWFDNIMEDDLYGEKTWEKAEVKMLKDSMMMAIKKAGREEKGVDAMLSGDLLNQLMSSSFTARDLQIPFLGLYGACSTMAESILLGSVLVDGGYANSIVAAASSHYCTAERQFRMPLEHGNQRPPSAQWTVTGAGAVVIENESTSVLGDEGRIVVTCGTIGKVVDVGIKDSNQMGAAMAPAAIDTLCTHFEDTGRSPDYYDLILTGDLGWIGKRILLDQMKKRGFNMEGLYEDCGVIIYDDEQDVHSGGSGCGCSAGIFAGRIYKELRGGALKKVFLISTGALLSTISPFQGESIPGIAHGIALEYLKQ